MEKNFEFAYKQMRKHEGGFSNNPKDKGGATMKGVTLNTFRSLIKPKATVEDLKAITEAQLRTIYRKSYWNPISATDLPSGVDFSVFDYAVNSGPAAAVKALQKIVIPKIVDGKAGPATVKAAHAWDPEELVTIINDNRLAFLKRIRGGQDWKTFGKGWTNRVKDVKAKSLELARNPPKDVETRLIKKTVTTKKAVPVALASLEKPWYSTEGGVEKIATTVGGTGLFGFLTGVEWEKMAVMFGFLLAGGLVWYFIRQKNRAKQLAAVSAINDEDDEVEETVEDVPNA